MSPHLLALIIGIVTLTFSGFALSRRLPLSHLSVTTVGLAMLAIVFVGRPLTLWLRPDFAQQFMQRMPEDSIILAMGYFALWVAIFTGVVLLVLWRERKLLPPEPLVNGPVLDLLGHTMRNLGIMGWVGMFLKYVVMEGKLGTFAQFVHRADASGMVIKPVLAITIIGSGLVAYQLARRGQKVGRFLLAQFLLSVLALSLGGRTTAFAVLLVPLMIYLCTRRGYVSWYWLSYVMAIFLVLAGSIWIFRSGRINSDEKVTTLIVYGLSHSLGSPYDYYVGIVDRCTRNPAKMRLGQTYQYFLLRPFKGGTRQISNVEAPGPGMRVLVGQLPTGGVPATALGEGFWNFGVAGLVLSAVMVGLAVGLAEKLVRWGPLPLRSVWVLYLAFSAKSVFHTWFQQSFSTLLPGLVLLLLVTLAAAVQLRPRCTEQATAPEPAAALP